MRGYNLSSRPEGVKAYDTDQLTADIRGLIHERGAQSALLVGHDWGGTVAWATAMKYPEVVDRLAILNAAHPRKLSQGLHHPGQLRKSWYFFFFDLPELPEAVVHANRWHFFRHFLRDARPAYTPEEIDRYIEAWSQPGAATGMINYYRSSVRQLAEEGRSGASPDLGADPGHLGPARSLPRPRTRRTRPRRRTQPRPRRAPARRLALGPSRRGRAGHPTAHRLLRPRPTSQELTGGFGLRTPGSSSAAACQPLDDHRRRARCLGGRDGRVRLGRPRLDHGQPAMAPWSGSRPDYEREIRHGRPRRTR